MIGGTCCVFAARRVLVAVQGDNPLFVIVQVVKRPLERECDELEAKRVACDRERQRRTPE